MLTRFSERRSQSISVAAENLIVNNLNPQGLTQLYGTWKQELNSLKRLALTECKFAGLSKNFNSKLKMLNRRIMSAYDLPKF